MKYKIKKITILALVLLHTTSYARVVGHTDILGVCEFYKDAYKKEIKPKLSSGLPFELMTIILADNQVVFKKIIHLTYDLWDEIIIVKENDEFLKKIPIRNGEGMLCNYLGPSSFEKRGKVSVFKLLLNPLWAGRIARLAGSDRQGRISGFQTVEIDWDHVKKEMPVEKVLLVRDILP